MPNTDDRRDEDEDAAAEDPRLKFAEEEDEGVDDLKNPPGFGVEETRLGARDCCRGGTELDVRLLFVWVNEDELPRLEDDPGLLLGWSLAVCPSQGRVPDVVLAEYGLDGGGEAEGVTRGGLSVGGAFHVVLEGCRVVVRGGSMPLCWICVDGMPEHERCARPGHERRGGRLWSVTWTKRALQKFFRRRQTRVSTE